MTKTPTLKTLKKQYSEGTLSKQDFIKESLAMHQRLFDYVDITKNTDVNEISITPGGISFLMKDEGIRLFIPAEEARVVPVEVMNFGSYEPGEAQVIDLLSSSAKQILDIGANIGWYAVRFAKRNPNSKIYAFEPLPVSYSYLQRNIAVNDVGSLVSSFNFGLSEACGKVDFFIAPTSSVNASMLNVADSSEAQKIVGLTLTLDQWCENNQVCPDFIKCDVEGAELLVFRGAQKTLLQDKPVIFTELLRKWSKPFGYHPNELLCYLHEMGYICYAVGVKGVRLLDEISENTIETNYAFVHKTAHENLILTLDSFR